MITLLQRRRSWTLSGKKKRKVKRSRKNPTRQSLKWISKKRMEILMMVSSRWRFKLESQTTRNRWQ